MLVRAEELHRFVAASIRSLGARSDDAVHVADVLVAADLGGLESHGTARLRRYVSGVQRGRIAPQARIEVVRETPTTATLDAGNGLGQPAAVFAMRLAMAKANDLGLAVTTLHRSNHFGVAGYYARMAARQGLVAIVATNAMPQVAPAHGAQPMYGTNPLAFGLPTDDHEPFVFDAATSVVPRGRLERLAPHGGQVPAGWVVDPSGRSVSDAAQALAGLDRGDGHALLPLGGGDAASAGHKGYGLGVVVDLLCGPLAGAAWGRHVYGPSGAGLGHFFLCLRAEALTPLTSFREAASQMFDELRASRPAQDTPPVRVPGDRERVTRQERLAYGIPLDQDIYRDLMRIAGELGVAPPVPIGHGSRAAR